MRYEFFLSLFILTGFLAPAVEAQDTRYRVELLVLTHLRHGQEPEETVRIEDYSAALDFLTPPEEAEQPVPEPPVPEPPEMTVEAIDETESEAEPDPVIHVEEMGEAMQEAWRRLRTSAPFRPEQYLSWEQGDQEPFPVLRVHDLDTVMTEDPWAEARAELEEQGQTDSQTQVFADAAGLNALENEPEPELPDPIMYYRLDGTANLTRRRFLHLDLDLQLREAVWEEQERPLVTSLETGEIETPAPSSFLVHSLKQSRQVKTGRMEYFDGPVLGVLAFITSIKMENEDPP